MATDVYKYLVVAAVFLSHFLQYGAVYGIGIYYILIEETYSAGPTEVSLLCSIFTATFFAIAPISSVLTNRYGCRPVTMVGGIIGGLGFISSSFVYNISYLYFTFGILAGSGLGCCGTPAIVIVTHYFKKRRALAYGLGLSGVGLGAFAFPLIVNTLIDHYHLRGSMLITGALCFHLTLCGVIFRQDDQEFKQDFIDKKATSEKTDLLNLSLFRDLSFVALSINCFLAGLGQSIVFVHIGAYASNIGLSQSEAAAVISVTGITNCFGRLFFGLLPLIRQIGKFCPYMIGLVLSGFIISMVGALHTYLALCILVGAFGFLFGAFGALEPQVALEIVGERFLANAFGFLQVFVATGSLLGPPIAGYLFESTTSYSYSFYLGGGALILSGISSMIPWCHQRCFKPDTIKIIADEDKKIRIIDT